MRTKGDLASLELEKVQILEAELYKKAQTNFKAFLYATFPEYQCNWHHDVIMQKAQDFAFGKIKNLIVCIPPQHGKLIENGFPVLTTRGWKYHGDLQVGDFVFSPEGRPVQVVATSKEQRCNMAVTIGDTRILTHSNHEWVISFPKYNEFGGIRAYHTKVVETKELLKLYNDRVPCYVSPPRAHTTLHTSKPPIDPYVFGLWLGAGGLSEDFQVFVAPEFTDAGAPTIPNLSANLSAFEAYCQKERIGYKHMAKSQIYDVYSIPEFSGFSKRLAHNKMPKYIPHHFLLCDFDTKMLLLAGIMDSHVFTTAGVGRYVVWFRSEDMQYHFRTLLASMGMVTHQFGCRKTGQARYFVNFTLRCPIPTLSCKVEYLAGGVLPSEQYPVTKVERLSDGDKPVYGKCIQVDSQDGLYLIGTEMFVTHNSEIVSRKLPAFILGIRPHAKIVNTSYSTDLVKKFNRDVQRTIMSAEYRKIFPETRLNPKGPAHRDSDEVNSAMLFEVIRYRGSLTSVSIGGPLTGTPCDVGIVDDPHKDRIEAESETMRRNVWDWYSDVFLTRMHNESQQLITMTRWHEDDLVGRVLKEEPEKWEVLTLPYIKEQNFGWERDPRKVGEALWPQRHSAEKALAAKKRSLRTYTSLMQQRPAPEEGTLIKSQWWRFYDALPAVRLEYTASWDLTFDNKKGSDYVVGQVWGRHRASFYLIDMVRGQWDFTRTLSEIVRIKQKYPQIGRILVEEKANGAATLATLQGKVPGLIGVSPSKSKIDRVSAITPLLESGCVYVPHPEKAPWVQDLLDEAAFFPSGANDDTVDCMTQYLNYQQGDTFDLEGLLFGEVPKGTGEKVIDFTGFGRI